MPIFDISLGAAVLWALVGYGLGAIPFGIVLARVFGLGDLRQIGSGNIGATNVLRTGSKAAAALTLILDAAKGAVAVWIARAMGGEAAAQIAALMALIGHCYPVWLSLRGGKGVATFIGLWLALAWPVGLAACATWAATAALTRISSAAALAAAALVPVWALPLGSGHAGLLALVLGVVIFWRHRENIARLRAGTEPKIGR